ncbi:N-acetylneuraminate synthase family protein [Alteromonas stellipolaris]|jgi:N,N'-diacetyllegionaminate synthase|uniref:N-acetylneuraminate synthase family protein n=1 Tax=Alteromonas stellipolaris TaxID=233316 RepID=UPI0026E27C94|nr:N-acetylneuraminate synthase family protein [Alteromonas stellipolaris]MDO6540682.1 N-acetylneuraminate synthase family protein [Alteromonas stellipolaris]
MTTYRFSKNVTIGKHTIGAGEPTYVIAEAGVNHNGDIALAKKLIDTAVSAGADAVKFQLFNTDALIKADVKKAAYQVGNKTDSQSQYEMLKALEISADECKVLAEYAAAKSIDFLVTPFDEPSLSFLATLGLSALKISSTDLTNTPFLLDAAKIGVPIILSTGMSEQSEVDHAISAIHEACKDVVLLQCTSSYPAPEADLNLRVIRKYAEDYGVIAGYSDHTVGIGASPYAVAAGALVIEKHFTLDKTLPGPDHQASLSPDELISFMREIRRVDTMMGRNIKRVELCERENRLSLQKCLVASCHIEPGVAFNESNICAKRTGGVGIPANYVQSVYGKLATKLLNVGDIVNV